MRLLQAEQDCSECWTVARICSNVASAPIGLGLSRMGMCAKEAALRAASFAFVVAFSARSLDTCPGGVSDTWV